jgi:hypothetical protein
VAAKLEIGDPVIALSDVTDRTSFRKLGCIVATIWGRHYKIIFLVQQIIENRHEFNLETHIAFIDFEKAFDKIYLNKLWNLLNAAIESTLERLLNAYITITPYT